MAKFKKKTKEVTTPSGVFVFPSLTEPSEYEGDWTYSCKLRMSPEDAAPLIKIIDEQYDIWLAEEIAEKDAERQEKAKKAGKKAKKITEIKIAEYNKPYGHDVDKDTGEELEEIVFKTKLKAKGVYKSGKREGQTWEAKPPVVVDAKKKRITVPVWGGSVGKLRVALSPYFVPALGFGVKMELLAAQVTDLKTAGGKEVDIDDAFDEEDGYEAPEQSEASTAPVADTDEADEDDEF